MRITQGTFSFLPDLTDEQIARAGRVRAAAGLGGARSSTPTTRIPRNTYWEMWGMPMFDLKDAAGVLMRAATTAARPTPTATSR
ncbi:MAG: ribulose bisphosphate carboxylase small subunit [Rhodopseudomonas palustris]|nr:ribulose bisphosphate carboxylase small subunit [Rhodopseudomonas palustris]